MTAKKFIEENLKKVLGSLGVKNVEPEIKISDNSQNGDYYTNVAMRLSSTLKKKPIEIAYQIRDEFTKSTNGLRVIKGVNDGIIEKVEVAAPGFINFFLSEKSLIETVQAVSRNPDFGNSNQSREAGSGSARKIMIEFTDPNPFKEFHIGHLYPNIIGSTLARLFESQGAKVARVCYQGDVGLHVAKAIYGIQRLISEMPDDTSELSIRAQFMGKAYAYGATKFEDDEAAKKAVYDLNKKVYDADDESVNELYEKGRAWSLEYFDSIYARLGTKFQHFYFESEMAPIGLALVREYLKKGVFEENDGAIIFPGKKFGLHNRVFINSLGLPTYEAKDLGLFERKYKDFPYDKSIIVTGKEQAEYFKVVAKAFEQINPDLANKTKHISNGLVRLPTGKMSSRTGDVITGEWLMDEAVGRIQKEYPDMDDETSEKVGLGAIKFAFLKSAIGEDMTFSFEESISLSGASGPYIQYTYVRTQSILAKSKGASSNQDEKMNEEERELIRHMVYFPEIVTVASEKLAPNLVAEYLLELAQKFNNFYQKHQVVGNENRIELTRAVGNVLSHGLNLLGIETVGRM